MSQITLLYDQYIKTVPQETTCKDRAMETLSKIVPARDYARLEECLSLAEDKMTEDAFRAGFRAAIMLAKEALS